MKKARLNENRISKKVYTIVAFAGGISSKAISLLCPTYSYMAKHNKVSVLREKGLLKTKRGLTYFTNIEKNEKNWKRYTDVLLTDIAKESMKLQRSNETIAKRIKKQSEIMAMAKESGISLAQSLKDESNNYYISKRSIVNELITEDVQRNEFLNQAMGVWFNKNISYIVFSLPSKELVWNELQERFFANRILTERNKILKQTQFEYTETRNVGFFVSECLKDSFKYLIYPELGETHYYTKPVSSKKMTAVAIPDRVFDEVLLIEKSQAGINLMKMLQIENVKAKLDIIAVGTNDKPKGRVADKMDKIDGLVAFHINMLYPDIVRFDKFIRSKGYDDQEKYVYVIHCFDYYVDAFKQYVSSQNIELKNVILRINRYEDVMSILTKLD